MRKYSTTLDHKICNKWNVNEEIFMMSYFFICIRYNSGNVQRLRRNNLILGFLFFPFKLKIVVCIG